MKKRMICLIVITLSLFAFGVMAQAAAVKATLSGVKGSVFVQPAGGTFEPAKDGAAVSEGATLKTGPDGTAVLKWGNGNTMKLMPLTLAKVEDLKAEDKGATKSSFSLEQGRVVNRVGKLTKESSFTVKTPTAIAGVRGTAFDTGYEPTTNQTTVAVVEGDVSLTAGGVEVLVNAGFESAVSEGGTPAPPTEIPPEQLQELKTTVSELKIVAEETVAPAVEEKPAAAPEAEKVAEDKAIETVQEETVQKDTINNAVIEEAGGGCPTGGGCIQGTIILESSH